MGMAARRAGQAYKPDPDATKEGRANIAPIALSESCRLKRPSAGVPGVSLAYLLVFSDFV